MSDGYWHIALTTSQRGRIAEILTRKEAFALYDRAYETHPEASNAEQRLRSMLDAARAV